MTRTAYDALQRADRLHDAVTWPDVVPRAGGWCGDPEHGYGEGKDHVVEINVMVESGIYRNVSGCPSV